LQVRDTEAVDMRLFSAGLENSFVILPPSNRLPLTSNTGGVFGQRPSSASAILASQPPTDDARLLQQQQHRSNFYTRVQLLGK
jgi:hypothetical protein